MSSLHDVDLFHLMDPDAVSRLEALAEVRLYSRGDLLSAGSHTREFVFGVVAGSLRMYRAAPNGQEITLRILNPGDSLWLLAFDGDGPPRSVAQTMRDDTVLLRLPGREVAQALTATSPPASFVVDVLCHWLAEAYDRLEDFAFYDTRARLAHALGRLARGRRRISISLTHEELATLVGSTRERVTKELGHLRAHELVAYRAHTHGLTVLKPDLLATL